MKYVVDTNVPIVANGNVDPLDVDRKPSPTCRLATIEFLETLLKRGQIVLDSGGAIQEEYHRYLNPKGQPGVGDLFYREVINSLPNRVERLPLPRNEHGDYVDFPEDPALNQFDLSDRKFAALARRALATVANATDSDWLRHKVALGENGIAIKFLCTCDWSTWFE